MVTKGLLLAALGLSFFGAYPTSTNYSLKSYDLGNGGGGSGASTNYSLNASVGSQGGQPATSTNYGLVAGVPVTQNASVPLAPTLSNPSSEYVRLKLVLNNSSNPSDTLFAIAISSDNFVTTKYVKADTSMGNTLALTDYKTYAAWGGASGFWVTGLAYSTTYKVKVAALEGNLSGTAYGPTSAAVATVSPSISFGVATSSNPTPPFTVSFTSLNAGTVYNSDADAVISLTTNAMFGGSIFIADTNNGLNSAAAAASIPSVTADLTPATSGYGAIVSGATQSSGGPIASVSPYNGSANNVGALSTVLQNLANTSSPITSASVTVQIKAKAASTTPSSADYQDTLSFIAAMAF